jgi:predicted hydrocarbon binding protein
MSTPFDIGRFIVSSGRKIYGFLIKATFKHDNLLEIVSLLTKHNVKILFLSFSRPTIPAEVVTSLSFCDFTEADISVDELKKEIKLINSVEQIEIIYPETNGFIADTASFPLKIGENRAIIIRDIGYKGLLTDIRTKFGSAAEAFLYYLGFEAGLEYGKDHKRIAEEVGLKEAEEIHDNISMPLFISVGYGRMEKIEFKKDKPYVLLRVYDNFECELGKGSNTVFSHFVRGMIAGVLSELLGINIYTKEIRCIAMGDPYCEFESIPKSQISV